MSFLLLGLGLLLSWIFWGLGLALCVLPTGWRRFLFALCVPFGLALQIAAAWWLIGWDFPLKEYGPWANLVPLGLLGIALAQRRKRRWLRVTLRSWTLPASAALVLVSLFLALLPPATGSSSRQGLTTFSIGSVDAADYALGARFFLEQGRGTPGETWAQYEHRGYWEYWRQINHFGPAALLAMSAATFRLETWQVMSVLAASLGACAVPLALAFASKVMRFGRVGTIGVGLVYAVSPLWLHAVYHVALGQLAGTLGISSFLLLAVTRPAARNVRAWSAQLASGSAATWLFFSSYPLMAIFAVAILAGVAGWRAIERRKMAGLPGILLWGLGTTAICAALFPARMYGFVAYTAFGFRGSVDGWHMGSMQLPTVFGLGLDQFLDFYDFATYGLLYLLIGLSWMLGVLAAWRRRDPALPVALAVCAVVFGAAFLLTLRDPGDLQVNSYKVYKLTAVYLPVLLPALFIGIKPSSFPRVRLALVSGLALVIVIYLPPSVRAMWRAAAYTDMRVTPAIRYVRTFERDGTVPSVNLMLGSPWLQLWACTFLAKKEIHFPQPLYGHFADPLSGNWTLEDDFGSIYTGDVHRLGEGLVLRETNKPSVLTVGWGKGWWDQEGARRWSGARGRSFSIMLESAKPITGVEMLVEGRFREPNTSLRAFIGERELTLRQDMNGRIAVDDLNLETGSNEIRFVANRNPRSYADRVDQRTLLLLVNKITLTKVDG